MVDSHFQVQLTAVLDMLMKTAVSDICAVAESWFKSLHLEIARRKQENEDLRQKLQNMEQKEHQDQKHHPHQEHQEQKHHPHQEHQDQKHHHHHQQQHHHHQEHHHQKQKHQHHHQEHHQEQKHQNQDHHHQEQKHHHHHQEQKHQGHHHQEQKHQGHHHQEQKHQGHHHHQHQEQKHQHHQDHHQKQKQKHQEHHHQDHHQEQKHQEHHHQDHHQEHHQEQKHQEHHHQEQKHQHHQEHHQPSAETVMESKVTKQEEDTISEVRDTEGCTVFAGTSAEDLAVSVQLWPPSSEEDSQKRNTATEPVPAKRARSRWNHTVGTKTEMVDRSVMERVQQKLVDTEINSSHYTLSSELKTESERSQLALETSEYCIEVGSQCENESEDCVVLDEVCETDCPEHRREEEQHFDVSCLWTPEQEPNSTHLLSETQSAFTNSDCSKTFNLGRDLDTALAAKNNQHLSKRTLVSLPGEKGNIYTCNICGKNLSTKNSLASHYRLHTGEKPFMCAQCGKGFAKKFNLDIHYNIHTGVKPYMCTLCPKSFADPSAFRRHEWIHTRKSQHNTCNTKYRYSCNTCGKCFLSKPSLAAHSQLHAEEKRRGVQKVLFQC